MKLATLKDGSRDGKLVVVNDRLTYCTDASHIAPTLQAALDDWDKIAPKLKLLAESLSHEAVPTIRFHEHDALSPLPRSYQCCLFLRRRGRWRANANCPAERRP